MKTLSENRSGGVYTRCTVTGNSISCDETSLTLLQSVFSLLNIFSFFLALPISESETFNLFFVSGRLTFV